MLILLNVLIPLSIPDHADQVNNMVVMTIKITCIVKLLGTLNKNVNLRLFAMHRNLMLQQRLLL